MTTYLDDALAVARAAANAASDLIRARWDGELTISYKGEVNLVSDVDLAAEALIVDQLRRAFPRDAIVGEEGSGHSGGSRVWYIDPLDGTTNFSHGHPHYAVSIGLVDGNGPALGVIAAPAYGWTFHAQRGGGAFRDDQPIAVSSTEALDRALLATGFPYDRRTNPDNNSDRFCYMIRHAQGVRRMGAAALDLAFVAAGWLDGFWEAGLGVWDIAAGVLIATEAGGVATGLDGGPLEMRTGALVVSNGRFHDALVAAVTEGHTAGQ